MVEINLKNLRIKSGLKTTKIAELLGISRVTLYNLENGKIKKKDKYLLKLKEIYKNVNLTGEGNMEMLERLKKAEEDYLKALNETIKKREEFLQEAVRNYLEGNSIDKSMEKSQEILTEADKNKIENWLKERKELNGKS